MKKAKYQLQHEARNHGVSSPNQEERVDAPEMAEDEREFQESDAPPVDAE